MIAKLENQYRFLSNFWSCFVVYDNIRYPSTENAYQAAKCLNKVDRKYFETCKASEAKRQGKIVKIRTDWENVKLDVMYNLLKQKFNIEPYRWMLLDTNEELIEEGNWWGDTYWDTCNGVGENHLGKLLMKVRSELRKES